MKKPPLRIAEVADRLGVHRDTVYTWINSGVAAPSGARHKLACIRIGSRKRIRRRDLQAFLLACQGVQAEKRQPAATARARRAAAEFRARVKA